ncbi:hypothetical protein M0R45_025181 [Rubus argutus]|uniref:RRM domain-containing protein n=1 Tax=Rubus argutus TaxID=59490 RepID=A0AAW1WVC2_RUBAR
MNFITPSRSATFPWVASERDIKEFFSFSGDIAYVEMKSDTERSQIAYVTFKGSTRSRDCCASFGIVEEGLISPLLQLRVPPAAIAPTVTDRAPGGAESAFRKAEDVVTGMLAKGFILGKDGSQQGKGL